MLTMVSPRKRGITLFLCIFFGYLGIHRFYVGKWGTGLIWIFTGGISGLGYIYDLIIIILGSFEDKEGKVVSDW